MLDNFASTSLAGKDFINDTSSFTPLGLTTMPLVMSLTGLISCDGIWGFELLLLSLLELLLEVCVESHVAPLECFLVRAVALCRFTPLGEIPSLTNSLRLCSELFPADEPFMAETANKAA